MREHTFKVLRDPRLLTYQEVPWKVYHERWRQTAHKGPQLLTRTVVAAFRTGVEARAYAKLLRGRHGK